MRTRAPLFAVLLLAGCPASPSSTTTPASTNAPAAPAAKPAREVVLPTTASLVDPTHCGAVDAKSLSVQVFEGLVRFDDQARIEPGLAESWKISDDLTVYSFTLRKGLVFSDGSPLRAAEVVGSFERYARGADDWFWVVEPIAGARAFKEGRAKKIEGLRAQGELGVEIRLSEPDGIFLLNLAMEHGGIYRGGGHDPLVGAGPYRVESQSQVETVLVPSTTWHGWGSSAPGIDRLVFRHVQDSTQAFVAGEVHVARVPAGAKGIDPKIVRSYPGLVTDYAFFSPDVPRDVRRLVNAVLDRDAYCKEVLDGAAVPSHGVLPPSLRGARAEPLRFELPPGKVAKMKLRATLEPQLFERLERALAPHGVELVRGDPPQLFQTGWIADYPDADDFLRILFHSKSGLNKAGFARADVDALLEKARRMSADLEDETRLDVYRKAEDAIVEDAPWLFLWHHVNRIAVSPRVKGVRTWPLDCDECLTLPQTTLSVE
jgi:peptide/nickel transport system substrate-binding protein/oligopeptide transport system substrate-binding protein